MKNLYLILLYLLPCICLGQDKIYYNILKTELGEDKLISTVGGNDFIVVEGGCLEIHSVLDLNNDGYKDVILIVDKNCYTGKTHTYPNKSYKIITYDGFVFHESNMIGEDVVDFRVYDSSFGYFFEVHNSTGGQLSKYCGEKTQRFMLKIHSLELVYENPSNLIPSLFEVSIDNVDELLSNWYEQKDIEWIDELYFKFDINMDNKPDSIVCSYVREINWNINTDIYLSGGPKLNFSLNRRFGILGSTTNNFHDLVINCDEILIWNGTEYIRK